MKCFPLDNTEYEADALGAWSGTRTRGVFSSDNHYAVTANGNMTVTLSPGIAWLKPDAFWGAVAFDVNANTMQIDTADGALTRWAAICIRLDKNLNRAHPVIKYGPYGTNPALSTLPLPARDIDADEIYPAAVRIRAGTTEILTSDIVDLRINETYCGIMRDGVTSIPTQALENQWREWTESERAEFAKWVRGTKDLLNETTAGNLLLLIQKLETPAGTKEIESGESDEIRGWSIARIVSAVRNTLLAGFEVGQNAAVVAGDRLLAALGKLQGQINALVSSVNDRVPISSVAGLEVAGALRVRDHQGFCLYPWSFFLGEAPGYYVKSWAVQPTTIGNNMPDSSNYYLEGIVHGGGWATMRATNWFNGTVYRGQIRNGEFTGWTQVSGASDPITPIMLGGSSVFVPPEAMQPRAVRVGNTVFAQVGCHFDNVPQSIMQVPFGFQPPERMTVGFMQVFHRTNPSGFAHITAQVSCDTNGVLTVHGTRPIGVPAGALAGELYCSWQTRQ